MSLQNKQTTIMHINIRPYGYKKVTLYTVGHS